MRKTLIALAGALILPALAAAQTWDSTKPAAGSLLNSSEVRGNFQALGQAAAQQNMIEDGTFQLWPNGTSSAPYGWTLAGTGAAVAQETGATNLNGLGAYSVKLTYGSAALTLQRSLLSSMLTYYRSKTFSAACGVKASASSQARLELNDGIGSTYSSYHTGGGSFEWLTVTRTLDASASSLVLNVRVESTGSAYVQGCVAVPGPVPPAIFAAKRNVWDGREIHRAPMGLASDRLTSYSMCGTVYVSTSSAACGAGTETNLLSWTMPAGLLATDGDMLRVRAWINYVGSNAKTVKVYLGATSATAVNANTSTLGSGVHEAWIVRYGATSQRIFGFQGFSVSATSTIPTGTVSIATAAETLANALTVKWTGQGGASDVTQIGMAIDYCPAPN